MKTKICATFFCMSTILVFGQLPSKKYIQNVDPKAMSLNSEAVTLVNMAKDSNTYVKAIALLDEAIAIDSNYFFAQYHKAIFLNDIKQYNRAIEPGKHLIRLKPNITSFYEMVGMDYYLIGDSLSGDHYYTEALTLCDQVLDTMSTMNKNYDFMRGSRAIFLIMLKRYEEGNKILKELCDKEQDYDEHQYWLIYKNKTREEILEEVKRNGFNK